jgi:ParB-like chromosome segregation protein Spo0J
MSQHVASTSLNVLQALHVDDWIADIVNPQNDVATRLAEEAVGKLTGPSKESGVRKIMEERGNNINRVSPFLLRPVRGFNARDFSQPDNQAQVERLCESIMEIGVKQPIIAKLAKDGMLEIIDGETRWRAVMRAINVYRVEIRSVPVVSPPAGLSEADLVALQNTANMNKEFHPLELAVNVRRFRDWGWSFEKIQKQAGVKEDLAKRLLDALELPAKVQQMIRANQVALTTALNEAKKAESSADLTQTLQEGLQEATKAGRTKLLKKHINRAKGVVSVKKAYTEATRIWSSVEKEENRPDGKVAYLFSPEEAAAFEAFMEQRDAAAKAAAENEAQVDADQMDVEDALAEAHD